MAPSPPPAKTGLSAMAAQTPTKSISARLMTMKFMQRAAASETSLPSTPTSDDCSTGKRRKVSHTPTIESPSTPLFDTKAAQTTLQEEEKKREAAVARLAEQLGDSHWVLDGRIPGSQHAPRVPLKVVHVGFAQIDSPGVSEEEPSEPIAQGKKSFGPKPAKKEPPNIKQDKKRKSMGSDADSSSASSDEESGEDTKDTRHGDDGGRRASARKETSQGLQSSFSKKRDEERKKSQQFAGKRRKKDVNLNRPLSISSAGAGTRFAR